MEIAEMELIGCYATPTVSPPAWIRQTAVLAVLDHPARSQTAPVTTKRYMENPYLAASQPAERFQA